LRGYLATIRRIRSGAAVELAGLPMMKTSLRGWKSWQVEIRGLQGRAKRTGDWELTYVADDVMEIIRAYVGMRR